MKNSISNQDFKQILNQSQSLLVRDLLFYYDNQPSAISFIVNRKKGGAILRNQFKRRCRALFNLYKKNELKNIRIIIKPNKVLKNNFSWQELSLSFENFCSKLEL